jgi:hypothetical protein
MELYLVKDGIKGVGYKNHNNQQVLGTTFYLITYDFETNEGYVEEKGKKHWRLYTRIGQKIGEGRHHEFITFEQCLAKLKELKGDGKVIICNTNEVENLKQNLFGNRIHKKTKL